MNALIDSLNAWGERFFDFALPILWQSSLLMLIVFAADFLLRRKLRPAVRYTLWFAVFLKLLLPPTLALPTGPAWWMRMRPAPVITTRPRTIVVSYTDPTPVPLLPSRPALTPLPPPPPSLEREAWILLGAAVVSALL